MDQFSALKTDMCTLLELQRSFCILQPIMDKKDDMSNALADVWNALLDARGCIIRKILDSPAMAHASFEADLQMILAKRVGKS